MRPVSGWLAAADVIAEARAAVCRACNGRPGPCTCGTACRCTCPRSVHDHWRPGTDCGRCGKAACPRYRRRRKINFWRRRA